MNGRSRDRGATYEAYLEAMQNLRSVLKQEGVSIEQMAKSAGCSVSHFQTLCGKRKAASEPPFETKKRALTGLIERVRRLAKEPAQIIGQDGMRRLAVGGLIDAWNDTTTEGRSHPEVELAREIGRSLVDRIVTLIRSDVGDSDPRMRRAVAETWGAARMGEEASGESASAWVQAFVRLYDELSRDESRVVFQKLWWQSTPEEGYGHPSSESLFAEATLPMEARLPLPHDGQMILWQRRFIRGDCTHTKLLADVMLERARRLGAKKAIMDATRAVGETHFYRGEFDEAVSHLEAAVSAHEGLPPHAEFDIDSGASAHSHLGLARWIVGRVSDAERVSAEAVERSKRGKSEDAQRLAKVFQGHTLLWRGNYGEAKALLQPLASDQKHAFWQAIANLLLGIAAVRDLRASDSGRRDGLSQAEDGIAGIEDQGMQLARSYWNALLVEAMLSVRPSRTAAPLRIIDEVLQECERSGEGVWVSELLSLRASIAPERAGHSAAEFRRAVDDARNRGAWSLVLRAATRWLRVVPSSEATESVNDALGHIRGGARSVDVRLAKKLVSRK